MFQAQTVFSVYHTYDDQAGPGTLPLSLSLFLKARVLRRFKCLLYLLGMEVSLVNQSEHFFVRTSKSSYSTIDACFCRFQ